jgi:hypothetical protein
MDWELRSKYVDKTCPSANLSTANPTWPGIERMPPKFKLKALMAKSVSKLLNTEKVCVVHSDRAVWDMNVFARSNAGIVGLNHTQGMDICVRLFFIWFFCV